MATSVSSASVITLSAQENGQANKNTLERLDNTKYINYNGLNVYVKSTCPVCHQVITVVDENGNEIYLVGGASINGTTTEKKSSESKKYNNDNGDADTVTKILAENVVEDTNHVFLTKEQLEKLKDMIEKFDEDSDSGSDSDGENPGDDNPDATNPGDDPETGENPGEDNPPTDVYWSDIKEIPYPVNDIRGLTNLMLHHHDHKNPIPLSRLGEDSEKKPTWDKKEWPYPDEAKEGQMSKPLIRNISTSVSQPTKSLPGDVWFEVDAYTGEVRGIKVKKNDNEWYDFVPERLKNEIITVIGRSIANLPHDNLVGIYGGNNHEHYHLSERQYFSLDDIVERFNEGKFLYGDEDFLQWFSDRSPVFRYFIKAKYNKLKKLILLYHSGVLMNNFWNIHDEEIGELVNTSNSWYPLAFFEIDSSTEHQWENVFAEEDNSYFVSSWENRTEYPGEDKRIESVWYDCNNRISQVYILDDDDENWVYTSRTRELESDDVWRGIIPRCSSLLPGENMLASYPFLDFREDVFSWLNIRSRFDDPFSDYDVLWFDGNRKPEKLLSNSWYNKTPRSEDIEEDNGAWVLSETESTPESVECEWINSEEMPAVIYKCWFSKENSPEFPVVGKDISEEDLTNNFQLSKYDFYSIKEIIRMYDQGVFYPTEKWSGKDGFFIEDFSLEPDYKSYKLTAEQCSRAFSIFESFENGALESTQDWR